MAASKAFKWSAPEVAALLAAWRDALMAPKYHGFSVRTHMFERFAERCGGTTARALGSVCFKRETLRNMSDLICAYHKQHAMSNRTTNQPKSRSSTALDDAALPWFALSVAERKTWFAAHNERSYTFLDIDAPTFKEAKALNGMAQRAEDAKRRCYRRVLLRKSASGEWEAVREQGVGFWAAAAASGVASSTESATAMSTPEATVSEDMAGGGDQSSVHGAPAQRAVDGTALVAASPATGIAADATTHAELCGDRTHTEDGAVSSDEPLPQYHHHYDGDDGSSTESESDLGAWEEDDEDDDDESENNSSFQDTLSQLQQEGESNREAVNDFVCPKQVAVESETHGGAAVLTPVQSHLTVVRAETISSRGAEDSDKAPDQLQEEKQPSRVAAKAVDVIRRERAVLTQPVAKPSGPKKAVHKQPVEKLSSATTMEVTASSVQPPTEDANEKQPVPDQELLNIIKNLEMEVQHMKKMLTRVENDKKTDKPARTKDAARIRGLEMTVQGLAEQVKKVQAEQARYRGEDVLVDVMRNKVLTKQLCDIKAEGRDQRHLISKEITEIQAKWASQNVEQKREVEELRLECAKLQKEAGERDQEFASLKQDMVEVQTWMKQAVSSEATPKLAPVQDQAAAAVSTSGDVSAATSSDATSNSASVQDLATPANGSGDVSAEQRGRVETKNPGIPDPERVRKRKRVETKNPVTPDPERVRKGKQTMSGQVKVLRSKLQAQNVLGEKTLPTSELNPKKVIEKTPSVENKKPRTRPVEQPLKNARAMRSIDKQDTNRAPIAQQLTKRHVSNSKYEAKEQQTQSAKVPGAPGAASATPVTTSRTARSKASAKQTEGEPEQEESPVAPIMPAIYRTRGSRSRTKENSV